MLRALLGGYALGRLLNRSGKQLDLLEKPKITIPPGENVRQEFYVENEMKLHVSGVVNRGKDVQVGVFDKAELEYIEASRKSRDPEYILHQTIDQDGKEKVTKLSPGEYMIVVANEGQNDEPVQVDLDTHLRSSNFLSKLYDRRGKTLPDTRWSYIIVLNMFALMIVSAGPLTGTIGGIILFSFFAALNSVSMMFDAKRTKKRSDFPKSLTRYHIMNFIPFVALISSIIYLYMRKRTTVYT